MPRASDKKPLNDEGAAFARERDEAGAAAPTAPKRLDWDSFTVAFKGVLLEGLEVTFIVVSFGSTQGRLGLAAAAGAAARVVLRGGRLVVPRPPEPGPPN